MKKRIVTAVISALVFVGLAAEGSGLVRLAAAALAVDVATRKAALSKIPYANMTTAAALVAAYALHCAGVDDAYTMAPKRGTIMEGAEWLWEELVEGRHPDLLRARSEGGRPVAWIELFIREFPDHPSAAKMRAWRGRAARPLSGNMGGGPTTCLYRRTPAGS